MMSLFFFFFFLFEILHKYEKGVFDLFLLEKKVIYICKKLKIMLQHSPIGFGLVTIFLMLFLEHTSIECEIPFGFHITNVM